VSWEGKVITCKYTHLKKQLSHEKVTLGQWENSQMPARKKKNKDPPQREKNKNQEVYNQGRLRKNIIRAKGSVCEAIKLKTTYSG